MSPEYYEGVILVTIQTFNNKDKGCSNRAIMQHTGCGPHTIINAIDRLKKQGRLIVHPAPVSNQPHRYEITDPPGDYDKAAYQLHLASRGNNGQRMAD